MDEISFSTWAIVRPERARKVKSFVSSSPLRRMMGGISLPQIYCSPICCCLWPKMKVVIITATIIQVHNSNFPFLGNTSKIHHTRYISNRSFNTASLHYTSIFSFAILFLLLELVLPKSTNLQMFFPLVSLVLATQVSAGRLLQRDTWGGSLSLGPTKSNIVHAVTTLVPGTAPSPQNGMLFLWPGMSNGTGDLIQTTLESWPDNSWCGAVNGEW